MEDVLSVTTESGGLRIMQNRHISDVIQRERLRLLRFIRKRVDDEGEAEDILQDVFYELTEAYRLMKPIEQVGAWLYRVARNRIVDRFRKGKREAGNDIPLNAREEGALALEDLLPAPEAGPEALYARGVLFEELNGALEELPKEQRDVFIAHEIDGRSFKELAEDTGLSINTLLSRKRYAILHLRRRLQAIYEEFTNK
ncbi:MAG TPA: sigma-70 family RNA polymerase sigma factor [Bryobacteraceae bacterium]|jgi:RNA polymerase sigma factor (sigma-70 family)|nr:sigma-70 family RNA polymerase sigma factor [Bryobacteraceae bacterium]